MNNEAKIMDMFYRSETKPHIRERLISREQYLEFLEGQLEENKVLCVQGVEGVGVTTMLALFAKRHGSRCASYFNNGWSRYLLNPKAIVSSLQSQLELTSSNTEDGDNEKNLTTWVYRLNKMTRGKDCYFYFVFDGFDNLPAVFVDGIKSVLTPLFSVSNAHFVFSGDAKNLKQLLPEGIVLKQTNELFKFQENDVDGYLRGVDSNMKAEDISIFYNLSKKGNARLLTILTEKLQKYGIQKIRDFYQYGVDDFYAEDYEWIEAQERIAQQLMALLAFARYQ